MKFTRINDSDTVDTRWDGLAPKGLTGETVWMNEEQTCMIILSIEPKGLYTQAWYDVHIIDSFDMTCMSVSCAKDGVSAFIVNELMRLACECSTADGRMPRLSRQVRRFFSKLGVKVDLASFHHYRDNRESDDEI